MKPFLAIALLSALVLTCCATHRPLQVAERVTRDTVYINKLHYDSIYVSRDHFTDRTHDTIYLRDVSVKYRYKLLRDTIYKEQHDSIPYEVRIETIREVPRRQNILDYFSYAFLGLVIGSVLTRLYHYFK